LQQAAEASATNSILLSSDTLTDLQKSQVVSYKSFVEDQMRVEIANDFEAKPGESVLSAARRAAKDNPAAVHYVLRELTEIFSSDHFPDSNIDAKRKNLDTALRGYCQALLKENLIRSCDRPAQFTGSVSSGKFMDKFKEKANKVFGRFTNSVS